MTNKTCRKCNVCIFYIYNLLLLPNDLRFVFFFFFFFFFLSLSVEHEEDEEEEDVDEVEVEDVEEDVILLLFFSGFSKEHKSVTFIITAHYK